MGSADSKNRNRNWSEVKSPAPEQVISYKSLPEANADQTSQFLSKLAVLKLNGGLGTTMGCVGPKR